MLGAEGTKLRPRCWFSNECPPVGVSNISISLLALGSPLLTIVTPATSNNSLVFIYLGTSKLYFSIAMSNSSSLFLKPVSFSSPAGKWFPRKIPRVSEA